MWYLLSSSATNTGEAAAANDDAENENMQAEKQRTTVWGAKEGEEQDGKDRPKRPLNSFMLFQQDMSAKISAQAKEDNPGVTPQEVVSESAFLIILKSTVVLSQAILY